MKFDDDTSGSRMKDRIGCSAITLAVATFQATKVYGGVEHRILPLIQNCTQTFHKIQGTTLDKTVTELDK